MSDLIRFSCGRPFPIHNLKSQHDGCHTSMRYADPFQVMRTISGGPNVVEFIAAYRELDRVFVVMNYFPHDDIFVSLWFANFHDSLGGRSRHCCFQSLIHKIPIEETLEYMRNLFIALHHIHRFRVIHRDVKPANFLYNRAERRSVRSFDLSFSVAFTWTRWKCLSFSIMIIT